MISLHQIRKRDQHSDDGDDDDERPMTRKAKLEELYHSLPKADLVPSNPERVPVPESLLTPGDGVAAEQVFRVADVLGYCIAGFLDTFRDVLALSHTCGAARAAVCKRHPDMKAFCEMMAPSVQYVSQAQWRDKAVKSIGQHGASLLYRHAAQSLLSDRTVRTRVVLGHALLSPFLSREQAFTFFERVLTCEVARKMAYSVDPVEASKFADIFFCRPRDLQAPVDLFCIYQRVGAEFVGLRNVVMRGVITERMTQVAFEKVRLF